MSHEPPSMTEVYCRLDCCSGGVGSRVGTGDDDVNEVTVGMNGRGVSRRLSAGRTGMAGVEGGGGGGMVDEDPEG
jgi:hypothetical protein